MTSPAGWEGQKSTCTYRRASWCFRPSARRFITVLLAILVSVTVVFAQPAELPVQFELLGGSSDPEVLGIIPFELIKKHQLLPVTVGVVIH